MQALKLLDSEGAGERLLQNVASITKLEIKRKGSKGSQALLNGAQTEVDEFLV